MSFISNIASITYNGGKTESTCEVVTRVEKVLEAHSKAYSATSGVILAEGEAPHGIVGKEREIIYEIVVTNYSSLPFTNVVVEDGLTLPNEGVGFKIVDCNYENVGTVTEPRFEVGTLDAGDTVTIRYTLEWDTSVELGIDIQSGAHVTYTENPSKEAVAAEELIVKHSYTDVVAMKTGPSSVLCGATYTYMLTFVNNGDATATVETINDTLPVNFTLMQADSTFTGVVISLGEVTKVEGEDYTVAINEGTLAVTNKEGGLDIPGSMTLQVALTGIMSCDIPR